MIYITGKQRAIFWIVIDLELQLLETENSNRAADTSISKKK